jgi:Zn finger protein HypA/HybF involved in hydrogenase expression
MWRRVPAAMHEMNIAKSILDAMRKECPDTPAVRIGASIGDWLGVNPVSLQSCWAALLKAEEQQCELEIEFCPRQYQCPECEWVFPVEGLQNDCPRCACKATAEAAGDGLELAFYELAEA